MKNIIKITVFCLLAATSTFAATQDKATQTGPRIIKVNKKDLMTSTTWKIASITSLVLTRVMYSGTSFLKSSILGYSVNTYIIGALVLNSVYLWYLAENDPYIVRVHS